MLGLLRTACAASRASTARQTIDISRSLPFLPQDWVFRFFPKFTRDKVRYMYFYNQVSVLGGFLFFYLYCHTPHADDNYYHEHESWMEQSVKNAMWKSGKLDECKKVKRTTFYDEAE